MHLVQIHGIVDSIKYQQKQNLKSARNIAMGCGWIFNQENNPNQHKLGHRATVLGSN